MLLRWSDAITPVIDSGRLLVDPISCNPYIRLWGICMKDIHEVLRRKQAKYAQLGKQIEMLQQAAEKLREVASLLTDNDEDDSLILAEAEEPAPIAARAAAGQPQGQPQPAKPAARTVAPRWP
jgi:hypothetical protein